VGEEIGQASWEKKGLQNNLVNHTKNGLGKKSWVSSPHKEGNMPKKGGLTA